MSTAMNYISAPEFADDKLTEAINIPPYKTGRPAQLGIFKDTPIHTTYVRIGVSEQELTVIPARERGGESNLNMRNSKQGVEFTIPHFPLDDAVSPSDVQNLSAWSTDGVLESVERIFTEKLDHLRAKHDFTHSHLDWGALNGVVLDADGSVLVDIYDKFDLAPTEIEFDLDVADTVVSSKNREAKALLRRELRGVAATGARVLAGSDFFDSYVSHPNVREELRSQTGVAQNPGRDDIEDIFTYAGLTLERIDEQYYVRQPDGTLEARHAIAADEAILVPLGTPYFKRYIAPPDTLSGANRMPEPSTKVFISTHELPHDKGREIHSESNVLPICIRPQVMIRLKKSG